MRSFFAALQNIHNLLRYSILKSLTFRIEATFWKIALRPLYYIHPVTSSTHQSAFYRTIRCDHSTVVTIRSEAEHHTSLMQAC